MIIKVLLFSFIIFIGSIHFWGMFIEIKIDKKMYKYLLGIMGLSYALLAFFIDPPVGWDLYRHYEEIDRIRNYGLQSSMYNLNYEGLFIINIIFYIISLFPINNFLVLFVIMINYSIYSYIILDMIKNFSMNSRVRSICFFLFFAFSNIVISISGVRNVLAFLLVSLGIYLEIFRNKKNIGIILLYIIPIFIHQAAIFLVFIRILTGFIKSKKILFVMIFWGVFLEEITLFLKSSSIIFISRVGNILDIYNEGTVNYDMRLIFLNFIIILIYIYYVKKLYKKLEVNETNEKKYLNYVLTYLVIMIGSLINFTLFVRMLYSIAILIIPVVYLVFKKLGKKEKSIFLYTNLVYFSGIILYQFTELYHSIFKFYF